MSALNEQQQPTEQLEPTELIGNAWDRITGNENTSSTVQRAVEQHLGKVINLTFDAKDHFLNMDRMKELLDGELPKYLLGEIEPLALKPIPVGSSDFITNRLNMMRGFGGSDSRIEMHNDSINALNENKTTIFCTDRSPYFSDDQDKKQTFAAVMSAITKILLPPTIGAVSLSPELKQNSENTKFTRRTFLRVMLGAGTGLAIARSNILDFGKLTSSLESDPEFLQYEDAVVVFRNFMMVQAAWNILQRIASIDKDGPVLFTVANGHDAHDGSGCSDLFVKGPAYTEERVRGFANILIDRILTYHRSEGSKNDPVDVNFQEIMFSGIAERFCMPYQVGRDIQLHENTGQEFKVPAVLLLEQLKSKIEGDTSREEKLILARLLFRTIKNISENYVSLQKFDQPRTILEPAQVDAMHETMWHDSPQFIDSTSKKTGLRIECLLDPEIVTEINDPYITMPRYFGYEFTFRYRGFAVEHGLPYPLWEVLSRATSQTTDNPYKDRFFAEMSDGTLREVTH